MPTNPSRRLPHFRLFAALGASALFGVLSGCGGVARTPYERPALDVPARWDATPLPSGTSTGSPMTGNAIAHDERWWHAFGDPQLDALIERALATNNDLAAAGMRLYTAQLQTRLTATDLTPDVTMNASGSAARNMTHGGPSTRAAITHTTIGYELDLWGRLASQRDAARYEAIATDYDRRATALAIVGQTASAYWQIAALNSLAATTQESIDTAERTLRIVATQHKAGNAGAFEEAQAASALQSLQAGLTQLDAQREQQRNTLAIIFDQSPEHRETERAALSLRAMPTIPTTLPADVLLRRPDLQAAEARLKETLAVADAQRLSFYPTVSLFGSIDSGDTSLAHIVQNPIGTLGATLALPFIQWNTVNLTTRLSRAQFDTAVIDFRATFYRALADTRSAWAACVQSDREVRSLGDALASAQRAERIAEIRYRTGETSLTDRLSLQQARQQADVRLTSATYRQYINTLTLYLALGGDAAGQGSRKSVNAQSPHG